RNAYERLRAKAMLLTLRYTALRIGDVALLARDRLSLDGNGGWRIFLRTEKTGAAVFLPIPLELKAALDQLPRPRGATDDRYYFWNAATSERAIKGIAERTLAAVFDT